MPTLRLARWCSRAFGSETEREDDCVSLGANLDRVLELIGNPMTITPTSEGGFIAESTIWGRWPDPKGKPTKASRTTKLTFSKERILVAGRRS